MDSRNSSDSMQSSSGGGDEEYDSRAESNVSAFLNPSAHFGSLSNLQQPHQHHQLQPHLYDPLPILGAAFSQSPSDPIPSSSLLNLDAFRSEGLRSRPAGYIGLGNNLPGSSTSSLSASSSSSQSILAAHQGSSQGLHDDNGARASQPSDQTQQGVAPRNPKKRTRASRRAPTTVLTTDTSNFRAMVQEFTGTPSPPFSGSPYSRRLDLFGPGLGLRSGHLEPLGSIHPLRPSAQKVHQQSQFVSPPRSFFNQNNMVDAASIAITTSNSDNTIRGTAVTTTSSSNPSSINYHLPSDLRGLPNKQPQNMINMQNQMLPFQSLLQPQPLHSSFNVPARLGVKSTASNLPLPSFEELGMSHGHVNANLGGLPTHVATTEGNIMRLTRNDNTWRDHGREQGQLRPFDVNFGNKSLENVSTRGEVNVDPWICPSAE